MKKVLLLAILGGCFAVGCGSNEAAVEKVAPTGTEKVAGTQSNAIESSPNLPPAAKAAILGNKK